jgi:GT2 family glycosyltransferase
VRVLVQVHTWNDANVIGVTLQAILRQTLAVEEILIVDNGSSDATAELPYPRIVTVIRHRLNLVLRSRQMIQLIRVGAARPAVSSRSGVNHLFASEH